MEAGTARVAERERVRVGELDLDEPAGDLTFQLVGAALGDQLPVVEHRDAVGELIGLLQVVRGEEDRDAVADQVANDPPHGATTPGVEAGGGFVEEDDPGIADQGHGQIEPAAHPARVGGGGLAGGLDQVEPVEQPGDPASAFGPFQMAEIGHQRQVLFAGQERVHCRELTRNPDHVAHSLGLARRVVAGNAHVARVGLDQRGQDVHRRRFAGAVGSQQREDRAACDLEVEAVQRHRLAE